MSMNYASAEIMNNLVLALAKTEETIDYALSIQENALSYNSVTRNLQLLYGLSSIKSSSFSMIDEIAIIVLYPTHYQENSLSQQEGFCLNCSNNLQS